LTLLKSVTFEVKSSW